MTEPGQFKRFLARGGAWVMVQVVLMTLVIALAAGFRGDLKWPPLVVAGGVLLAAGGCFGLGGVVALGRNLTPYPQPRAGAALVQQGVYSLVRHPLYTSVMLMSLGWAMIWQSAPSSMVALALIPFFHAKARREERWLRQQFPAYHDFERRVPRFIPRIGSMAAMVRRLVCGADRKPPPSP